jgi:hypothetical protein
MGNTGPALRVTLVSQSVSHVLHLWSAGNQHQMRNIGESLIDVVRGYWHSALVMQRYHLLKVLVVSTTTLNHYIRSANIIRKVVGQVHSLNKGFKSKVAGHGAKP